MARKLIVAVWLLAGGLAPPATAAAQEPVPAQAAEEGIRLDIQDADLRLVISGLAEAGNLNVVFSELPSRRVTLRMSRPIPREQVPALLRSLAAANGLQVIEQDGIYRIVPGAARPEPQARDTAAAPLPELRLFVHRLRYARAARLAATLQSIFGGRAATAPGERPGARPLSERLREYQVPPFREGAEPEVQVEISPPAEPGLPGRLRADVQIVPDEATNSLIVRADAADWEVIRQAIEALDLRPLQVLIEGLIVEVRRDRTFELGVSAVAAHQTDSTLVLGELVSRTIGDLVLEVIHLGRVDVDAVLQAVSSKGDVSVLSRPVIVAQNNQEARILIGAERPFVQVFRSLPTDAAVRDQVVQYRDVGTSLSIVPTINNEGYVNLQIVQEVSTATAETQFGAPVISTREASTHLFVKNGQTIVIGGLIEKQEDRSRTGVPLLKDIPLLGFLFGSTRRVTTNSELFVFMTLHVIETDEDAERIRQGVEEGGELLRKGLPEQRTIVPPKPEEN